MQASIERKIKFLSLLIILSLVPILSSAAKVTSDAELGDSLDMVVTFQKKLASHGNKHAQYKLGEMYESGRDVKRDYAIALNWYEMAKANGHEGAIKKVEEIQRKLGGPNKKAIAKKRVAEKKAQQALAKKRAADEKKALQALAKKRAAEEKKVLQALAKKRAAEEKKIQQAIAKKRAAEEKKIQQAIAKKRAAEEKKIQQAIAKKRAAEEKKMQKALAKKRAAEEKKMLQALAKKRVAEEKKLLKTLAKKRAAEKKKAQLALAKKRSADKKKQVKKVASVKKSAKKTRSKKIVKKGLTKAGKIRAKRALAIKRALKLAKEKGSSYNYCSDPVLRSIKSYCSKSKMKAYLQASNKASGTNPCDNVSLRSQPRYRGMCN